jgi:iron complex transport system ATP-binding protein
VLERLEIAHLVARHLDELSSGEARRAVIGRALVHDPQALVLDEPSNSLDIRAVHDLQQTMRTLAKEGLTLVLVTHHLPDIVPEIGRVILLERGRIVADGAKTDVLQSGRLSTLFGIDVDVVERNGYFHAW